MKAISLWQPWASLWLTDRKVHETRHWHTMFRGLILVHAAKKFIRDIDGPLREILDDEFGGHWGMDLPTGSLIGAVEIISCKQMPEAQPASEDDRICGDWTPGRYAWKGEPRETFARPIPYRGRQRIFEARLAVMP